MPPEFQGEQEDQIADAPEAVTDVVEESSPPEESTQDAPSEETMLDAVNAVVDQTMIEDDEIDPDNPFADGPAEEASEKAAVDTAPTEDPSASATKEAELPGKEQVGDEASTKKEESKAESEDDASGELPDEPTEEEMREQKPRTRRRIESLLHQRNELRKEIEPVRQFNDYLRETGITQDDMGMLMTVGAALKRGDFKGFLETVQPYVDQAQQSLGQALPPDLQGQMDEGRISPQLASELAARRMQTQRLTAQQEQTNRESNQQTVQRAATEVFNSISAWEQQVSQRDPDYAQKADMVQRYVGDSMRLNGAPATPADAVKMAEEALAEVNKTVNSFQPPPKPTLQSPASVHSIKSPVETEPSDLMQVALGALNQGS